MCDINSTRRRRLSTACESQVTSRPSTFLGTTLSVVGRVASRYVGPVFRPGISGRSKERPYVLIRPGIKQRVREQMREETSDRARRGGRATATRAAMEAVTKRAVMATRKP